MSIGRAVVVPSGKALAVFWNPEWAEAQRIEQTLARLGAAQKQLSTRRPKVKVAGNPGSTSDLRNAYEKMHRGLDAAQRRVKVCRWLTDGGGNEAFEAFARDLK